MYVAVTRAKKRLKIIYTGDSAKVKETLVSIFDQNKMKENNFISEG